MSFLALAIAVRLRFFCCLREIADAASLGILFVSIGASGVRMVVSWRLGPTLDSSVGSLGSVCLSDLASLGGQFSSWVVFTEALLAGWRELLVRLLPVACRMFRCNMVMFSITHRLSAGELRDLISSNEFFSDSWRRRGRSLQLARVQVWRVDLWRWIWGSTVSSSDSVAKVGIHFSM